MLKTLKRGTGIKSGPQSHQSASARSGTTVLDCAVFDAGFRARGWLRIFRMDTKLKQLRALNVQQCLVLVLFVVFTVCVVGGFYGIVKAVALHVHPRSVAGWFIVGFVLCVWHIECQASLLAQKAVKRIGEQERDIQRRQEALTRAAWPGGKG